MPHLFANNFNPDRPSLFVHHLLAYFLVLTCVLVAFGTHIPQTKGPSDDSRRVLKAAKKLILKGDLIGAERVLREGLVASPNDASLKLKLAYALMKMRVLGEAYELTFGVAKADNRDADALSLLGAILLTGGRFNDSRAILTQALRIDDHNALALGTFGMLEFYENRIDRSLDFLAGASFYDADNPDFIFAFAQVAARAERYQEAAASYRKFLQITKDPDDERRARIRGLINFLEYLGGKQSLYAITGSPSSSVPFELKGNRPVILVRINGRPEPLRFVLDTGSGISVISDETARRLKIKPVARGGFAKGIGGNGKFAIVYGFLKDVSIGDAKIRNVPIYIREFHQNVHGIDGYIGISLISKFLTTIDYGERTFSLARFDAEQNAKAPQFEMSLPLRLTSSGFLSGEVQMEGMQEPMNFIVDTGASVSVVSDSVAKREPFSSLPRNDTLRVVGSAGVTENVEAFTIPKISLGKHSREKITAIALNLEIINDASGFEQSGILGGNFFLDYRMTFDFKNSRLLFAPAKTNSSENPTPLDEIKSIY